MPALVAVSIALAVAWALTAVVVVRFGERGAARRLAAACGLLAAVHGAAAAQAAVAPLVLGAWLLYALVVPTGRLGSATRRALAAGFGAAVLGWAGVLLAQGSDAARPVFVVCAVVVTACGAVGAVARYPTASAEDRRVLRWLAGASVLAAAFSTVCMTLYLMIGAPQPVDAWLVAALLLVPLGQVMAVFVPGARAAATALVESIAAAGVAALGAGVYLVVVVGIQGAPHGRERDVLLASLAAALVVAALAVPVRHRLVGFASEWIGTTEPSSDQVVTSFGARMSRAVPMDELMLQLAESLHATVAGGGAEIWAGADGVLVRTVGVPSRPPARLVLSEEQRVVVGRARVGGSSWASVWLPDLPDTGMPASGTNGARADLRVVPVAHLGELLGLIVVRGAPGTAAFTDGDERLLVDLARQFGLALHNVRLDSALQASLAELEQRNAELQASRLRIVSASDQARRSIERNLHDGAQQHLVALAVKLSLAREIADDGKTASVPGLLDDLRADVQTTIAELRELAHGIYPPLLRDRGLGEALRAAAARSPLACSVDVDLPARYPEEAESAAYFCCIEGLQNAGKHAGARAEVTVRVGGDGTVLWFEVADDGVGFDSAGARSGHGFLNMRDRLGAIGGRLSVESTPGHGARVSARIPAHPLRVAVKRDDPVSP